MREPVSDPWFVEKETPLVVAAGTLAPWKGFADLIRAVGELTLRGRAVRLVIFGEGPLRPELEALVGQLSIGDRVRLPGYVENPLKYFARADVFVLSSHSLGDVPPGVVPNTRGVRAALQQARDTTRNDIWIVGGAVTMQSALEEGLIDMIEIFLVPVLLVPINH